MISTLLAGKLLSRPTESAGDHTCLSAQLAAQLDRHNREVWTILAFNASLRAQIVEVGQFGHLAVAGVPRISCHEGAISRKLYVSRVLALLPEEPGDE